MRRLLICIVIGLCACTPRGEIRIMPQAAGVGEVEPVFIGTTRGPDAKDNQAFGMTRDPDPRYVRLDISIPPHREVGTIDWPAKNRVADPLTDFVTLDQKVYATPRAFRDDLSEALRNDSGAREAVVFVHGFNSSFAEGTYRWAQLGHDLNVKGALVHYSWPSRANPLGYVYDRDSALFARDGFEDLLKQVRQAGARKIVIVCHSMGAAIVMETLRQIAISGDRELLSRIAGIVLMSPDIDVDVFLAEARKIGKLPQPFVIFTSKKDRALALSAQLTGQRDRLGNLPNARLLGNLKVTLVDTTAFSSGLGHFNVGNSAALLALLGQISDVDKAFAGDQTGRTGLLGGVVLTVQNATQIVLSPVTAIASGIRP
jgi:esterase/lipase superfamily enzyme